MMCLDTNRSRRNWVPFMDPMLCTLTTYMCCLMNLSDSLLSAARLLRTIFLELQSLYYLYCYHVGRTDFEVELLSFRVLRALNAAGDVVA
jgi:hypothetical protein